MRIVSLVAALLITPATGSSLPQWQIYQNGRFGFRACHPPTLIAGQESGSGDGRVFSARDGAELRVFGEFYYDDNATLRDRTIAEDRQLKADGAITTYKAGGPSWFVRSGIRGGSIFYHKVVQQGDQFVDLQFTYPTTHAQRWAETVRRMSRCFT